MARVILFDVNETLLDLAALDPYFVRVFGDAEGRALAEGMRRLPPHPEVPERLRRLRDVGLCLATLTNSTAAVGEAQLTNAGLRDLFEQALSADIVRRLKPAPEPYRLAAEQLGVPLEQIRLVAAHAWDIAGARRVGCATAFVARPGQVLDPLAPGSSVPICARSPTGSSRWSGRRVHGAVAHDSWLFRNSREV